jgi:DNA polymerase I-like protein with 3'-5' exonuclease and polymerase domains
MTVGGVLIDTSLKDTIRKSSAEYVDQLYGKFIAAAQEATGEPHYTPNPKSPKQLSDLFFGKLRLVGRGTSTDDENRTRMFVHPRTSEAARKVLVTLGEYAKENKFLSTYANISIDADNRCRSEYKQTGVASAPGRLSSAQTLWGHYDPIAREYIQHGANLQNQPERSHEMFIADPGYGFGYFDLAQAEARVVAWDAKIDKWMHDFERARLDGGFDCHRSLASDMFKMPYDDVPTLDRNNDGTVTLRFVAKRCRHGLNYRMGADVLATTTGLSMSEAQIAFDKYHRATPELRRWWQAIEQEVRKTSQLFNFYGRRLLILQRIDDQALKSVVAFKPQSTIGDKVVRVIYLSESDPRWPSDARIALNIHDALICIAPIAKLKTCLSIMKKYAQEPLLIHGNQLIIPADLKIADSASEVNRWSTLEKVYVDAAK